MSSKNIYNSSMGDYSVIISDTLCVDTLYFQIDNFEEMNGFILNDEYNILQSDTLFLNDSCYVDNTYSYGLGDTLTSFNNENTIWNLSGFEGTWTEENTECLNGDWCVIETDEDYYIYFNNSGIYNLSVYNNTNLENCTDNGDEIEIVVLEANCSNVSLNELNYNINIHGDILSINNKNPISDHHIKLFDSTGKLIITLKEKKNNISINTEKYVTGIYTLQITSNNNIYTEKIILNK